MFPTTIRNDRRRSLITRGFEGGVNMSGPATMAEKIIAGKHVLSDASVLAKEAGDDLRDLELHQHALGLWERTNASDVKPASPTAQPEQNCTTTSPSAPPPEPSSESEWEDVCDFKDASASVPTTLSNGSSDDATSDEFAPMPAVGPSTPRKKLCLSSSCTPDRKDPWASMTPMPRITSFAAERKTPKGERAEPAELAPRPDVDREAAKRKEHPSDDIGATTPVSSEPSHEDEVETPDTQKSTGDFDAGVPLKLAGPSSIVTVQENALTYVAAERQAQAFRTSLSAIRYEWLHGYICICVEESEAHLRLQQAFLELAEQIHRFTIHKAYDKFVVFSVQKEPVWRKAARQLQVRNEERINSTENMYARFALAEEAYADKQRFFQEAADYIMSVSLMYEDEMQVATDRARDRRRSTIHAAPPLGLPTSVSHHTAAASAGKTTTTTTTIPLSDPRRHKVYSQRGQPNGSRVQRTPTTTQTSSPAPAIAPLSSSEEVPQRQYRSDGRAWTYAEQINGPSTTTTTTTTAAATTTSEGDIQRSTVGGSTTNAATRGPQPPHSPNQRHSPRQHASTSRNRNRPTAAVPVVGVVAAEGPHQPHAFTQPVFGEVVRNPAASLDRQQPDSARVPAGQRAVDSGTANGPVPHPHTGRRADGEPAAAVAPREGRGHARPLQRPTRRDKAAAATARRGL